MSDFKKNPSLFNRFLSPFLPEGPDYVYDYHTQSVYKISDNLKESVGLLRPLGTSLDLVYYFFEDAEASLKKIDALSLTIPSSGVLYLYTESNVEEKFSVEDLSLRYTGKVRSQKDGWITLVTTTDPLLTTYLSLYYFILQYESPTIFVERFFWCDFPHFLGARLDTLEHE